MKKQFVKLAVVSLVAILSSSAVGREMTDAEKKYKQMQLEKAKQQQMMLQAVMGKVNKHVEKKQEVGRAKTLANKIKMLANDINGAFKLAKKYEKDSEDIQDIKAAISNYGSLFTIKKRKSKEPIYEGSKEMLWNKVATTEKMDTVFGQFTPEEALTYAKKRMQELGDLQVKACKGTMVAFVEKPATKQKISDTLGTYVTACKNIKTVKDWRGRKAEMEKICKGKPMKRVSTEWSTFTPSRGTAAERYLGTELKLDVMCYEEITTTAKKEFPSYFEI